MEKDEKCNYLQIFLFFYFEGFALEQFDDQKDIILSVTGGPINKVLTKYLILK